MNCPICGQPVVGKPGGRQKLYCSLLCKNTADANRKKAKRQRQITCAQCEKVFVGAGGARRFCSNECRYAELLARGNRQAKEYYRNLYPDGIKRKLCRWCNEVLEVPAQKTLASRIYHEHCSLEAQRARYRIKSTKRRTQMKPTRISADQVVREYGEACHICSEAIDLSLPRTSKLGLTIDHVIPLSKGGSDEMENLRPAHWICNNRKSDKLDA